jgi:microcystin-dependent protein
MPGTASGPYIGQIMMVGFNFAPVNWALCNGQLLPISENEALFQLIGTTYGGDGQQTFGLPDLRGRVPVHQGTGSTGTPYVLGELTGLEQVTLNVNQLPSHQHVWDPAASQSEPTSDRPDNSYPAVGGYYAGTTNSSSPMGAPTIGSAGGNQPHNNVQPFLTVSFIISLFGIFPSQN